MENSELIKNFERIRSFMRQFYVYGFKSRSEYDQKSARSYDNERRRVENWLGDYMGFRREEGAKQVFLSMDSLSLPRNPLYQAFQARSFTDKDITLHFYILDILGDGQERTLNQIAQEMDGDYLCFFPEATLLDPNTLRKKLKEYASLGLVSIRKQGRELLYSLQADGVALKSWEDALNFFSEENPLGVLGCFARNRLPESDSPFRFKHHFLLHTLDSQILFQLLQAIREKRMLTLRTWSRNPEWERTYTVSPWKIYISAQNGRQYLLGRSEGSRLPRFFRVDTIHDLTVGEPMEDPQKLDAQMTAFARHLWGVSANHEGRLDTLEMDIRVEKWEPFIRQRLLREKRGGQVEILDENTCRYRVQVYDAVEMMPWLRTFTGRILRLECSNPEVMDRFRRDLQALQEMYGGEM